MMAQFYGVVKNARGAVSRLGTKRSGLHTVAASWEGAIEVHLYAHNGVDYANVCLIPWHGRGTERTLYDGPVSGGSNG